MANIGVAHVLASLIGPGMGGILFSIGGLLLPGLFAAGLSLFTMIITIFILGETWPKETRELNLELRKEIVIQIRKNKGAMWYLILWGFHTASFMIAMASLSFFAQIVFGINAFEIGILLMISGIFRAIVRFTLFKPTINKFGENNAIKLGLTMFLISFFLVGFSINLVMFFIMIMIISFAASLTRGPLNSKISQSVSPMEQGKINGYSSGLDSFAQIVGPLLGTFMLNFFAPYFLSFLISSIALVPFLMGFKTIQLKKYEMPKLSREKLISE